MKHKFLLCVVLALTLFTALDAGLIELYKKGILKLEPDPDFGKGVQWDDLFFNEYKDIVVAPDGSVFVINPPGHNFFKFSPQGQLIGKFGRQGEGPGDLYHPGDLSILDDKYLLVGEYALRRRFSLFNFSGKCVQVVKVKNSCFSPIALKNNHMAYYYYRNPKDGKKPEYVSEASIIIKNIAVGNEKVIDTLKIITNQILLKTGMSLKVGEFKGSPFIRQTKDGNLLVGISNSPAIKIYSPQGRLLRKFNLNIPANPVPDDYIKDTKNKVLNDIKERPLRQTVYKMIEQGIMKTDFRELFGEHLPYYRQIQVDSEGNILVFRWPDSVGKIMEVFQVYNPEGKYVCETTIDDGFFDFQVVKSAHNIQFTGQGVFGVFKLENMDDADVRLVKVRVK